MNGQREREDCGASGAVPVWRSRTLRYALLAWAAASVLCVGDGRTVQAQSFEPASECRVSGTTVTCTGDLSDGVKVDGGNSTYTTLVIEGLTGEIAPAAVLSNHGIKFLSQGDIDLTVDTGDFGITRSDRCLDCSGISAGSSDDGAVTVNVRGNITTAGTSSEGIDVNSTGGVEDHGGAVTLTLEGAITTSGDNSDGILAHSEIGDVTITLEGTITTSGDNSRGISASSDEGSSAITLNGTTTITSATAAGIEFSRGTDNRLTIGAGAAVMISGGIPTEADVETDVHGSDNNERIDNYGTLTTPGAIDLGAGTDVFNNWAGATFNSGDSVQLGSGNALTNWGDLSPGGARAVQRTELTGEFVNKAGGTYTVTVDPTGHDELYVRGPATLEGGTVKVMGAYDGTYTILTAAGALDLTGRFDEAIDTLFVDNTLSYNYATDTVQLSSRRNSRRYRDVAGSANQRAGASVLDGLPTGNDIVQAVLQLETPAQARAAYQALSGEVHASLKGALMDTGHQQVAAISRHLTARLGHPHARRSTAAVGNLSSLADAQSGFWMTGYGSWSETDATANTARMDRDLGGAIFGIDRGLGNHWRFGVLGSYGHTGVAQRARSSTGSVGTWSVGFYGVAEAGASRLHVGALYSWHSIDTRRTVRFPGFFERPSARYEAQSRQLFAEAGHQIRVRDLLLEPFAGVSYISLATDRFSEMAHVAALAASSDTNSTTFTTLGVRTALTLHGMVRARGMVGWRHAFGETDPPSTFTLPDSSAFTILGAPIARDAAVTEFGIEASVLDLDNVVLGAAYLGRYGDGVTAHGFNAGLKVTI